MKLSSIAVTLGLAGLCLPAAGQVVPPQLDCGFERASQGLADYLQQVRSGAVPHPAARMPKNVRPRNPSSCAGSPGTVTAADIFSYEDSAGLLATNFSDAALNGLMADAANALLVDRGDNFDFIGFWLNFDPDHTIGAAFYQLVENDVTGIGDVGAAIGEPPTFNVRPDLGLAGSQIEGFIMMWNVDSSFWAPGTGPEADFTRLALAQEFEHRYAMFLPPLLDGRVLQGDNAACGRQFHWNWQVDGQGSGMEISEWVGSSPASPAGLFISFNTDISGGVFSYTDLYLMGYVTPAEMDAGNSELRFMEGSNCASDHFGTISSFDSGDIIAAAGPRMPGEAVEDKDYRTGWIMLHLPGSPPTGAQLDRAAAILNQHTVDWSAGTLGRGTMDNTLPSAGNFSDLGGALSGIAGPPVLVGGGTLLAGDPASLTVSGAVPGASLGLVLGLSTIFATFKGGVMVPSPDEILLGIAADADGVHSDLFTWPVGIPSGLSLFAQYWVFDATGPAGFAATNGLSLSAP